MVFRPARVTPKPLISGLQTAVVVGPKGEEIYTDKYGRIKVQFHWDREGKRDEKSSCWMRCMQASAGKQWGTVFIPRIGQEVVIDFSEHVNDRVTDADHVESGGVRAHETPCASGTRAIVAVATPDVRRNSHIGPFGLHGATTS